VTVIVSDVPVELTAFEASADRNNVLLSWASATETNNESFRIERAVSDESGTISGYSEAGYVKGAGSKTERTNYSYTDKNLQPGKYFYRLKQVDYSGEYSYSNVVEVDLTRPYEFSLYQNYPNPFNPFTTIEYSVPEQSEVQISLYSIMGEKIKDIVSGIEEPGYKKIVFDGSGIASGIYFYTITAKGEGNVFRSSRKMVYLK
jgi:hypothetical protein